MHEKALMDDLLAKMLAVSDAEGGARITGVKVWLGALSHLSPEHFREHFDESTRGTLAEGAVVEATLDEDLTHPYATGVVLESVVVASGELPSSQIGSGTIAIAPQGHSAAQIPHPLQKS